MSPHNFFLKSTLTKLTRSPADDNNNDSNSLPTGHSRSSLPAVNSSPYKYNFRKSLPGTRDIHCRTSSTGGRVETAAEAQRRQAPLAAAAPPRSRAAGSRTANPCFSLTSRRHHLKQNRKNHSSLLTYNFY